MAFTKNKKRLSSKRSIRWDNPDQIDVIQAAVDHLNELADPGERVTFNNLVADSAYKQARFILGNTS